LGCPGGQVTRPPKKSEKRFGELKNIYTFGARGFNRIGFS